MRAWNNEILGNNVAAELLLVAYAKRQNVIPSKSLILLGQEWISGDVG